MYVFSYGNLKHAATREMMAQITLPAQRLITDAITESGDPVYEDTDTALDTDQKIELAFPDGMWHKAVFRENVIGHDKITVDSRLWKDGQYQPWRRSMVWCLVLLESWDFPEIRNEEGYQKLPEDCIVIMEAAVMNMRESFTLPKNFKLSL